MGLWANHLTRRNTRAVKDQTEVIRVGLDVPKPSRERISIGVWWFAALILFLANAFTQPLCWIGVIVLVGIAIGVRSYNRMSDDG